MNNTCSEPLNGDERDELLTLRTHNARLLDHLGSTLVKACADRDSHDVMPLVNALLDLGADPNHCDAVSGEFPLLYAVDTDHQALLDLLLSRGGIPHAADDHASWQSKGTTLMHRAAVQVSDNPDLMVSLLAAGGNPGVVRDGKSALDTATKRGASPELLHMMRAAIARHVAEAACDHNEMPQVRP